MKPYYKTDNCALYQCDNLDLLKSLPDNYIDLIYCDVLYGTGKDFEDYQDLPANRTIIDAHYHPRFKEMHRVLKNIGVIYIHCDYHISHWVRIILDEVFECCNFRNEIIWRYRKWGIKSNDFQKMHNTIFRYSKSKVLTWNQLYEERAKSTQKAFGNKKINTTFKKTGEKILESTSEKSLGSKMSDVWDISYIQGSCAKERERGGKYKTQKPVELLKRIIESSSNLKDIVADFYMGSCTTGEVAVELGRKFIGCDIGDNACKISKERIENIIE